MEQINTGCYFVLYHVNKGIEKYELWGPPESITDSTSVNWDTSTMILNRQSPLANFYGTGMRSITFTIDFHIEGKRRPGEYSTKRPEDSVAVSDRIIKALRAAVYANYVGTYVKPPVAMFVFGAHKYKGIVKNVNFTFDKALIKTKAGMRYTHVTAQISLDQPLEDISSVSADTILTAKTALNPFSEKDLN